jgi:hypothetical protein
MPRLSNLGLSKRNRRSVALLSLIHYTPSIRRQCRTGDEAILLAMLRDMPLQYQLERDGNEWLVVTSDELASLLGLPSKRVARALVQRLYSRGLIDRETHKLPGTWRNSTWLRAL